MYYMKNGLGKEWLWLAYVFAAAGTLASFGIGNMTQINTIANAVNGAVSSFAVTTQEQRLLISLAVGGISAASVFAVSVGGLRRVGDVCALLVPFMAVIYTAAAAAVIFANAADIPYVLRAILVGAFDPAAVIGGGTGITVSAAITSGIGRGIFSNEAGLGSSAIAHAAADVRHPAEQGLCGIFEVFLDTVVICTVTALVILLGVGVEHIEYGLDIGSQLTIRGFQSVFSGAATSVVVAVSLALFALGSVLSWSLYGARCVEFLLGQKAAQTYRYIFAAASVVGAAMELELELAWNIADTLNGLMALPNLVALMLLSPMAAKLSREYFGGRRSR